MAFPFLSTAAPSKGETLQGLLHEKERLVDLARQSSADKTSGAGNLARNQHGLSRDTSLNSLDTAVIPDCPGQESSKGNRHKPFGHRLLPFRRPKAATDIADDPLVGYVHPNIRGYQDAPMFAVWKEVEQPSPGRVIGSHHNGRRLLENGEMSSQAIELPAYQASSIDLASSPIGRMACTAGACERVNASVRSPGLPGSPQSSFASPGAETVDRTATLIPMPTFPATELFRTCATILATPLGYHFAMDPTKLNTSRLLFSPLRRGKCEDLAETVIVLDIGGEEQDSYTASLAREPSITVQKMILRAHGRVSGSSDHNAATKRKISSTAGSPVECPYPLLCTDDFSRLPYSDASVNIICARTLHKGIRIKPSASIQDLQSCLSEFHRVLTPGGCLEYIYFESELSNAGPLTAELEYYLFEGWLLESPTDTADDIPTTARPTFYPQVSLGDFLQALSHTGFDDVKHTTTKFGLFTLSQLFDHRGTRRPPLSDTFAASDNPFDEYWGTRLGWSKGTLHRIRALKLLSRVLHECESRQTGWRCVVGCATKRL